MYQTFQITFLLCHSQSLEKIIQRDFFPDVTRLQAQRDYLDAEECGDLGRMREISIRYGSSLNKSTPRSTAPCKNRYLLLCDMVPNKRIRLKGLGVFGVLQSMHAVFVLYTWTSLTMCCGVFYCFFGSFILCRCHAR